MNTDYDVFAQSRHLTCYLVVDMIKNVMKMHVTTEFDTCISEKDDFLKSIRIGQNCNVQSNWLIDCLTNGR